MNLYVIINHSQRDIELVVDGEALKEISDMYRMDGERYEVIPLCIPSPLDACDFCRFWDRDLDGVTAYIPDDQKPRAWQSKLEHVEAYCKKYTLETLLKDGKEKWEFFR